MPRGAAASATRARSSSLINAPVGLPGELRMPPRVRGPNAAMIQAYDINAACSGYLYALQAAYDYLQSTPDGRVYLKREEECVAACACAPVMTVNGHYHERLTIESVDEILDGLE